jgi:hypothetical protein
MVIGVRHLPRNSNKKQEDFTPRSRLAIHRRAVRIIGYASFNTALGFDFGAGPLFESP